MAEKESTSKFKTRLKNIGKFFKDIRGELKKVIWPTRKQLVNNTISVLITCFAVGIIIWIADGIFTKIVEWTLAR
jgi:preprotein translocase subunit SecE